MKKTRTPAPEKAAGRKTRRAATRRPHSDLERMLLSLGGESVVHSVHDADAAAAILAGGREFDLPVEVTHGQPRRSHSNASALWADDVRGLALVTGYALSGGRWEQHTWAVGRGKLYETTARFERYFGMPMGGVEAANFWYWNYLRHRYPDVMDGGLSDEATRRWFTDRLHRNYPGPMALLFDEAEGEGEAERGAA
jgi:hypothetical protein